MNFLAPWFLLGALAVAGPVLFHLIRRSARERIPFSSLQFLRPTPPRATRRRKLEHILLMLLRCLAILLLAAGFARPFFPKSNASLPPGGEGRQTIILLDTSASMRREGLWPKALVLARQYISKASPADRVAVVTFDQQPRTLVSFADWSSWPTGQRAVLAGERLDTVLPGWMGTHLGLAMITTAEQFPEDAGNAEATGPRDAVLISDLEEGAKLDGLQGHDWPKGVRFVIEKVDPARRGNAGLTILDAATANGSTAPEPRVRIVNARDSDREKFELRWSSENGTGPAGKPEEIYLPPGQTRNVLAPELPIGMSTGALKLTGDEEDFDNVAYFAASEKERVIVAYFGSESAEDPQQLRYYLERAFPETSRRQVEIVSAISNSMFSLETLNRAGLAVVPSMLDAAEVKGLREWIAGGKTALLVLTNAQSGPTLSALAGMADIEVSEVSGDYALLGEIDFRHPIFAAFADPRFSDFSRIHFWKHRRWTIPTNSQVRVLAKFDDGAPALAQTTIGKGSLLTLFSGWTPTDSQLALSSKFLPLMQTILDWSDGARPERTQFQTGESIPSPVVLGNLLQWRKPDGKLVALAAGVPFTDTDFPGIYSVSTGTESRRFAVNLPLDESRTAPLSLDDFARLGVPLGNTVEVSAAKVAGTQRHLPQAELESRQKLWRWVIVGLLAVALIEIVLGGWLAGRVKTLEVSA